MKILYKLEKIIYNIELTAIVGLLLSLSVFAFAQVILRNIFSLSIIWMATYNNIVLLLLAMLGASIATTSFERSHINIDLFQGILPFPYNKYLSALLTLIASLACLLFFLTAVHYVSVTKEVGKIEQAIHVPEWVVTLIFPICFLSMTYKFLLCFIKDLSQIKEKRTDNNIAE